MLPGLSDLYLTPFPFALYSLPRVYKSWASFGQFGLVKCGPLPPQRGRPESRLFTAHQPPRAEEKRVAPPPRGRGEGGPRLPGGSRARQGPPSRDRGARPRRSLPSAESGCWRLVLAAGRGWAGTREPFRTREAKNLHLRRKGSGEKAIKVPVKPAPPDRRVPGSRDHHSQAPRRAGHGRASWLCPL